MKCDPQTTLLDFLRNHVAPTQHVDAEYAYRVRLMIRWFRRAMRRVPKVADFRAEVLAAFCLALGDMGASPAVIRNQRNCFARLWKLAAERGWAPAVQLPPRRPGRMGPAPLPLPVGEPGTLLALFNDRYAPEFLPGRYLDEYWTMFRKLRACFGRDLFPSELSPAVLAKFETYMTDQRLSPITVKSQSGRLLTLWRFAIREADAPLIPPLPRRKIPRDPPDAWTIEEFERIVASARAIDRCKPIGGVPANRLYPAMLLTAYYTALRVGTLAKLGPGDVDLHSGWLTVPGRLMKNAVGQKFRLGEPAIEAIREIWNPDRERLFPIPVRRGNTRKVGHHFDRILASAGVSKSRRSLGHFHKVRRTAITWTAVHGGKDAAIALAGHSGPDVNARYIDARFLPSNDATRWLPALTGPAAPIGAGPAPSQTPAGLLAEARQLLALGHFRPCAMTLRVALELLLKEWCERAGGAPRDAKRHNLPGFAQALHGRGIIDAERLKVIRRLAHLGNCAAHGAAPDAEKARELLAGIELLLSQAPPSDHR